MFITFSSILSLNGATLTTQQKNKPVKIVSNPVITINSLYSVGKDRAIEVPATFLNQL